MISNDTWSFMVYDYQLYMVIRDIWYIYIYIHRITNDIWLLVIYEHDVVNDVWLLMIYEKNDNICISDMVYDYLNIWYCEWSMMDRLYLLMIDDY